MHLLSLLILGFLYKNAYAAYLGPPITDGAIAAVVTLNPAAPSLDVFYRGPQVRYTLCETGVACNQDQEWTARNLPHLENNQSISLRTASNEPYYAPGAYSLGNTLAGEIRVTLEPYFRTDRQGNSYTPQQDELRVWVANRESLIVKTDFGAAQFEAINGMDYYLILEGGLRGDQEYQLQISQVPLPPAAPLMAFGFGLLTSILRMSRKTTAVMEARTT
jgi:hypothetical protein